MTLAVIAIEKWDSLVSEDDSSDDPLEQHHWRDKALAYVVYIDLIQVPWHSYVKPVVFKGSSNGNEGMTRRGMCLVARVVPRPERTNKQMKGKPCQGNGTSSSARLIDAVDSIKVVIPVNLCIDVQPFDIGQVAEIASRYVTSTVLDSEESSFPVDVLAAMCCGPSISYVRVVAGLCIANVGRKARVDGIYNNNGQ